MKWTVPLITGLAAMAVCSSNPLSAQSADDTETPPGPVEPIAVMVLGTYHFANPGLDMVNIESDEVLTPRRQTELEAMTDALAEWGPTRIVVEAQPETDDLHMASYREEADERIAENRNEHFQIGYRLALKLQHDEVYGFDEQPEGDEPNYFPIQTVVDWAQNNEAMGAFGSLSAKVEQVAMNLSKDQEKCTLARNLIGHNDKEQIERAHSLFYYGMLQFGDATAQPGAETNAYWYMRNAKMFAKVGLIAEPGDRVLIIVGSGHKYWLDHFVQNSQGYILVDARPYLQKADTGIC